MVVKHSGPVTDWESKEIRQLTPWELLDWILEWKIDISGKSSKLCIYIYVCVCMYYIYYIYIYMYIVCS